MSQQSIKRRSVLTAFTILTLIAMIAWQLGSPILAAFVDLVAVAAVLIAGLTQHPGAKSFK